MRGATESTRARMIEQLLAGGTAMALIAVLFAGVSGSATGAPLYTTDLPAPFDSWGVTVEPHPRVDPADPRILDLSFESPLLGFRVHSAVLLPDSYSDRKDPFPVAYYLHGTMISQDEIIVGSNAETVWETTGLDDAGIENPFEPRSGGKDPTGFPRLHETLDRHEFLIVMPDAGETGWCGACNWIDLPDDGLQVESHLIEELFPLVEAVFDVRTDRGGRALFGHSMGANGTAILGFRHPDLFAFLGVLQGGWDKQTEPNATGTWFLRWRHHGFDHYAVDEIEARNLSPMDLAPQLVGANVELLLMTADGCVLGPNPRGCNPNQLQSGLSETIGRRNQEQAAARLAELGVPHTFIMKPGVHGSGVTDTFRESILPRLNKLFSAPVDDPVRFSYKTADAEFSIWGYEFAVDRPNTEFLNVLGARLDARDFMLAGTGVVQVTTPPAFTPGRPYRVLVTPEGEASQESTMHAGLDGRLELDLTLGAVREIDERKELVENGQFPFPVTRVEVLDVGQGAG